MRPEGLADWGVAERAGATRGGAPPPDGSLPADWLGRSGAAPLRGLHAVSVLHDRCGYCDLDYTAPELAGSGNVSRATFGEHLAAEVSFARRVLRIGSAQVSTVFVGGGTPTLMTRGAGLGPAPDVEQRVGLDPGAE